MRRSMCASRAIPRASTSGALAGEIKNFTGIDQAYEMPENAELHLMAGSGEPGTLAEKIIADLTARGVV